MASSTRFWIAWIQINASRLRQSAIFWVVIALLVFGVAPVTFYFGTVACVRGGYLEWGLTEMIIAYSEDHQGRPPKAWDDLEPYFFRNGNLTPASSLRDLRNYVTLDFDALRQVADGDPLSARKRCFDRPCWILSGSAVDTEAALRGYYSNGLSDHTLIGIIGYTECSPP